MVSGTRIVEKTRSGGVCARGHDRFLDPVPAHQVEDLFAPVDEMVRNDPAVTAPPDRFRAHDRATLAPARLDEGIESAPEGLGECMVGVIVEALVGPEGVERDRRFGRTPAQSAELGNGLIGDAEGQQRRRQSILVILRVSARSPDRPDIDDETDIDEVEELLRQLAEIPVDGMLISPGYQYESCKNDVFLSRQDIHKKFERVLAKVPDVEPEDRDRLTPEVP